VLSLTHPIHHLVYRNIFDHVKTANQFSDVYAAHRRGAGPLFLLAGIPHAAVKFLECYVWKRGFLDGWPGLVIGVVSSFYVFLKHAKAWEKGRAFSTAEPDGNSA
jgi:hypothetical protein